VTAVNDEGDSEPLESERGVIAKNPYGAWFVLLKAKDEILIIN
jgi:hypothetical protein